MMDVFLLGLMALSFIFCSGWMFVIFCRALDKPLWKMDRAREQVDKASDDLTVLAHTIGDILSDYAPDRVDVSPHDTSSGNHADEL